MVSLARKNLLHDRLRFVITVSGVAFAVTLVLVQVGLFMGLLGKATVTIENASADIWVTSRETPNVDFAHTFPETNVLRVRGVPGVARADNLIVAVHEHPAAERGGGRQPRLRARGLHRLEPALEGERGRRCGT